MSENPQTFRSTTFHSVTPEFAEALEIAFKQAFADVDKVFSDVRAELQAAQRSYPPMHSAHEGWAVIREELDELWAEVRVKDDHRDVAKMRREAVQVAAMAVRFILDVCVCVVGTDGQV